MRADGNPAGRRASGTAESSLIRYPAPLRPGDTIGVTSPSSGVPAALLPRLEHAIGHVRALGYEVVLGSCMDGDGVVSAPAAARADELTAMLTDPGIRAVIPPWGGELAVEVLPHLDRERRPCTGRT